MKILRKNTVSICPQCFAEIDASIIQDGDEVYMIKRCPLHGEFTGLIEKDAHFYNRVLNGEKKQRVYFENLTVAITHGCNLNCNICYLPQRDIDDFPLDNFEKAVLNFPGKQIRLSGGEPTLREDLPEIIEFIIRNDKFPVLLTNGIRLADINYVKRLKQAGLRYVHFSFNTFNDKLYEKIDGERLLKVKLRALKNLKRVKINISLSMMLVRGINEKEIKRILHYCLRNNSFIKQLRLRSSVQIGRYSEFKSFCVSEMVKMISKASGLSQKALVNPCLSKDRHMSCCLDIDFFTSLMEEIKIGRGRNTLLKKLIVIFKLLPKVGIKNLLIIVMRKLRKKKRLLDFKIMVRSWPDRYNVDLEQIKNCPSAHLTKDNKVLPFCYCLMMNGILI
ncbi:MAG: hypothetical protein AMJ95_01095 [Omnitrophica WOR_2 bacterium SM23_72]|nr:MAG: hypothetical protein AMJ95_01095 [Omnitrophica WOR_2 bacterium SM23_72]